MPMSACLIGMFVTNMRPRQVREARLFAQTVTFIAVFHDGLLVPGALAYSVLTNVRSARAP